ncbi:hypothetical protein [Maribacter sp. 2307ULW6-5]|uniref:hypothetical protein n=1 Tax=Maribacter sp. 2307ULW6-5 TaxID=3386275 RepID=UPI0039BD7E8B
MKKTLIICFMLSAGTLSILAQEDLIFESVLLTVQPNKIIEFEKAIAAHNKKFHTEGPYGARVYSIISGKNTGKYALIMGSLSWGDLDGRPNSKAHTDDNQQNVNAYLETEVDLNYMKFHPELSHFPRDFEISKLAVYLFNIKRFKRADFLEKVVKKVVKVYKEKRPDEIYGIYTNDVSDTDDMDFAFVSFFDSMAWMGKEPTFKREFEEVHGDGSYAMLLDDMEATTNSDRMELRELRKDLSGTSALVKATDRQ